MLRGQGTKCILLYHLLLGMSPTPHRSRWLTVTDAMAYLDAVKLEFRDQPDIYDEFLAIMGRFKTKEMLPPDVIVEVARLFRGRDSLVMRFNRFLPDGYKIGPADIQRMEEERVAQEEAQAQAQARERLKGTADKSKAYFGPFYDVVRVAPLCVRLNFETGNFSAPSTQVDPTYDRTPLFGVGLLEHQLFECYPLFLG